MVSFTNHWTGYAAFAVFVAAYILVIVEESLHLRKSKPVMVAAGLIWILTAIAYASQQQSHLVAEILRHTLLEYAELMLFLLSAMTFINTMVERNVFSALRTGLVSLGWSFRAVFWVTGMLAFLISPVADNLTTALVMGAVVMAIGSGDRRFISVACINVVVAANAGGAFSPFGDITTLMVWQRGVVHFGDFLSLFIPSLINWLVPAVLISMTIPYEKPSARKKSIRVKYGGYVVVILFLFTIAGTVLLHHFLEVPPFLGMMTGLGILKSYGHFLRRKEMNEWTDSPMFDGSVSPSEGFKPAVKPFDVFISMKRVEWDTLMFFYGIMLCVGGLGALGYLAALSDVLYKDLGATTANILVGILSAVVDNIPVMFAVLSMNPDMSIGQWLLVTLT
ncbi:MAG TPA: sodium:proton antiporter NhaD, partial [Nitrospira sp.]|nr:sodium:proton antiporter NhaD [Nitrospira sp.]